MLHGKDCKLFQSMMISRCKVYKVSEATRRLELKIYISCIFLFIPELSLLFIHLRNQQIGFRQANEQVAFMVVLDVAETFSSHVWMTGFQLRVKLRCCKSTHQCLSGSMEGRRIRVMIGRQTRSIWFQTIHHTSEMGVSHTCTIKT